jgi:hypothetical protein
MKVGFLSIELEGDVTNEFYVDITANEFKALVIQERGSDPRLIGESLVETG